MTTQVSLHYSKADFSCDLFSLYLMWEQKEMSRMSALAYSILEKLGKKLHDKDRFYLEKKWEEGSQTHCAPQICHFHRSPRPFSPRSTFGWSKTLPDPSFSWMTEKTIYFMAEDLIAISKNKPIIVLICVLAALYLLDSCPVLTPLFTAIIGTGAILYKILD